MSVDYLPQPNDTYLEDLVVAPGGNVIISRPCQVWQICVKLDVAIAVGAVAIVSISDDSTGYTAAHRKDKIICELGQQNSVVNYPHGLNLTRGLCATTNTASVDIFVSYD
jgi:hypothetical protein